MDAFACDILYLDEPRAAPGVCPINDISELLILDKSIIFLSIKPLVPWIAPYILEKCLVFNDSFKIPAKLLLITAVLPPDWIINALDDFIGYAVIAVIIEFNITIANPNIIKNSLWIIEKPTYIGMIDAIYVAKVAC